MIDFAIGCLLTVIMREFAGAVIGSDGCECLQITFPLNQSWIWRLQNDSGGDPVPPKLDLEAYYHCKHIMLCSALFYKVTLYWKVTMVALSNPKLGECCGAL